MKKATKTKPRKLELEKSVVRLLGQQDLAEVQGAQKPPACSASSMSCNG